MCVQATSGAGRHLISIHAHSNREIRLIDFVLGWQPLQVEKARLVHASPLADAGSRPTGMRPHRH